MPDNATKKEIIQTTTPEAATEKRVPMVNRNKRNGVIGTKANVPASQVALWAKKGWAKA